MTPAPIRCEDLRKDFGRRPALAGASLEAPAGRFTAILGSSGCGKTTLLRIVAGLETADGGRVLLGDRVLSDPLPRVLARDRRVGMVFQSLALWPHMTAEGHLHFVLSSRGAPRDGRPARARELLALVGLSDRGGARPAELSGGEQQRVALARALAGDPAVLLLDEPFGSLDAALRASLRDSVRGIQRRLGLTTVLVTHDQEEALAVADHLVVMRAGRVEQAGPPADVYRRPSTRFVAEFLGGAAVLPATVAGGRVRTALGEATAPAPAGWPDGPALAVVRPECARLSGDGTPARVLRTTFAGGRFLVEVALAGGADGAPALRVAADAPAADGAEVRVALSEPPHLLPPGAA